MDQGYSWLRLLIDSSFASRFLVDRGGDIVYANRAAESLFEYAPNELTGKPISVIFASPEDRDRAIPQKYFPARRIVGDQKEIKGRTKLGRELIMRVGTSPIETVAASFLSVTVFDITQYKQTERELLFRGRQLEEAKRRVSQFAFLAAHDLRERLQKIASCSTEAKTALRGGDMNAAAAANEVILESTTQAQRLAEALLEYSLQASAILNLEFINLRHEVDAVLEKLSETVREAGVEIENNVPADLRIKADRPLFMRLVRDLIEGSMSLRESSSGISISAARNEERNQIRLDIGAKDTGEAKTENKASNDPGSRIAFEAGLATVRSICEQHGWTVDIEMLPDRRLGFQVDIPLGEPQNGGHCVSRAGGN